MNINVIRTRNRRRVAEIKNKEGAHSNKKWIIKLFAINYNMLGPRSAPKIDPLMKSSREREIDEVLVSCALLR